MPLQTLFLLKEFPGIQITLGSGNPSGLQAGSAAWKADSPSTTPPHPYFSSAMIKAADAQRTKTGIDSFISWEPRIKRFRARLNILTTMGGPLAVRKAMIK